MELHHHAHAILKMTELFLDNYLGSESAMTAENHVLTSLFTVRGTSLLGSKSVPKVVSASCARICASRRFCTPKCLLLKRIHLDCCGKHPELYVRIGPSSCCKFPLQVAKIKTPSLIAFILNGNRDLGRVGHGISARLVSRLTQPYGEADQQREECRREFFKALLAALFQAFDGL